MTDSARSPPHLVRIQRATQTRRHPRLGQQAIRCRTSRCPAKEEAEGPSARRQCGNSHSDDDCLKRQGLLWQRIAIRGQESFTTPARGVSFLAEETQYRGPIDIIPPLSGAELALQPCLVPRTSSRECRRDYRAWLPQAYCPRQSAGRASRTEACSGQRDGAATNCFRCSYRGSCRRCSARQEERRRRGEGCRTGGQRHWRRTKGQEGALLRADGVG